MNQDAPGLGNRPSKSEADSLNPRWKPALSPIPPPRELAEALHGGDRTALARGITLVESRNPSDRSSALELLDRCHDLSTPAFRVAVSGSPGVGKSTLIDALGIKVLARGSRLAVLAIDPSSERAGGSILGDKTRMARLALEANAFIRPSPSAGVSGGVARATRAAITLCEAAGYDTVLVETVGVGQGETAVRHMVDCFVLLALAGAGDELQGIKRGIVEVADVIAVTKADGENRSRAARSRQALSSALKLFPRPESGWSPTVQLCSAHADEGISELWDTVERYRADVTESGWLASNRRAQSVRWLRDELSARLVDRLMADPNREADLASLEQQVLGGLVHPYRAAETLLSAISAR